MDKEPCNEEDQKRILEAIEAIKVVLLEKFPESEGAISRSLMLTTVMNVLINVIEIYAKPDIKRALVKSIFQDVIKSFPPVELEG